MNEDYTPNSPYENEIQALLCDLPITFDIDELHRRIRKLYKILNEENSEVCIVLTNNEEIAETNLLWRNIDAPTDVLSFPMRESEDNTEDLPLGDIMISIEYALKYLETCEHKMRISEDPSDPSKNTEIIEWNLIDELFFLVIHGTLHLLGYDHLSDDDENIMRTKEKELWLRVQQS